ncbi:M48 family metallopeptidase [Halotalea alkalilenta]|uniref:M48 family metallopeptidase n=1 Tax=Halotalea alkalilenta TaxID=376489 RepID=UPI000694FB20|nr:M48 family metallopeptidase [Halotalea alkalilenta]
MPRYRPTRKCARLASLTITIALLAGCVTSPEGRSQLALFSNQELDAQGAAAFAEISAQTATLQGAQADYVSCVADAITAQVPASSGYSQWQVRLFDSDEVNAFALPGGYIGVYRGLLGVAADQNQLAAVIGHEVAHVLAHHANERVSNTTLTQYGLGVAQSLGGEQLGSLLGLGAQYGVLLPYSRRQESEADVLGLDLMARAGFEPQAAITLWNNMERATQGATQPEWASTHPDSQRRIAELQNRLSIAEPLYRAAQSEGRRPSCG